MQNKAPIYLIYFLFIYLFKAYTRGLIHSSSIVLLKLSPKKNTTNLIEKCRKTSHFTKNIKKDVEPKLFLKNILMDRVQDRILILYFVS